MSFLLTCCSATVVVNGTLWWNSIESPTVFLDLENVMTRPSSTIANITTAPVANTTAPSTANVTVKATAISSIGENKTYTFGNANMYTTLTVSCGTISQYSSVVETYWNFVINISPMQ